MLIVLKSGGIFVVIFFVFSIVSLSSHEILSQRFWNESCWKKNLDFSSTFPNAPLRIGVQVFGDIQYSVKF